MHDGPEELPSSAGKARSRSAPWAATTQRPKHKEPCPPRRPAGTATAQQQQRHHPAARAAGAAGQQSSSECREAAAPRLPARAPPHACRRRTRGPHCTRSQQQRSPARHRTRPTAASSSAHLDVHHAGLLVQRAACAVQDGGHGAHLRAARATAPAAAGEERCAAAVYSAAQRCAEIPTPGTAGWRGPGAAHLCGGPRLRRRARGRRSGGRDQRCRLARRVLLRGPHR
jgi:hypothetical protein